MTFVSRPGVVLCLALGMPQASLARAQTSSPPREWTLEQVVQSALSRHPLVEAAQARITAAEGSRIAAQTFPNPVGTLWMENATFPGQHALPGVDRETSAYVTLPIEPLFQRKPRVRVAEELVKAAGAELTGERRLVALDTARAFYRVALAQVALDAADENRAALESLMSYNRTRVNEGASAEIELIRVQVEMDRATTTVALGRIDLARSWAELRPFVGQDAVPANPAPLRVRVPDLATTAPLTSTLAELLNRARTNRPEILSARARAAAATADVTYQRSLAIRQVGATFGFKQTHGSASMVAALSVPIPLFDRNKGEVQRASSAAIAAQKELAWAERRIEAEVQGAYDAAQQLGQQAGTLQRSFVDRAAEGHRITLAAYQEGATSLLQVLDASRSLADARLMFYRTLLGQQQSVLDLALASGTEPFASVSILHASQSGDGLLNGGAVR